MNFTCTVGLYEYKILDKAETISFFSHSLAQFTHERAYKSTVHSKSSIINNIVNSHHRIQPQDHSLTHNHPSTTMPSSSSRNTALEFFLYHSYLKAFNRLYHDTATHRQASMTTHHFAELLDTEPKELQKLLLRDHKAWEQLEMESDRLTVSAKVLQASDVFADVATELGKMGREEEARDFWTWATQLVKVGWSCSQFEGRGM
jgi:DNA repair ATPase RecN